MKVTTVCLLAALGVAAAPSWAQAQATDAEKEARKKWTYGVVWENDRFANTDRHYTNGAQIRAVSPRDDTLGLGDWLWDDLLLDPQGHRRVGFALGQSMFTPDDLTKDDLIVDDRPYAGWLYGTVAVISEGKKELRQLSLDVGVVGPWALGEEVQTVVHEAINVTTPQGWDNQLENEPGVVLSYQHRWRNVLADPGTGLGIDLTPHLSASAGNVFTHAAAGLSFRFGQDLPADYGPPRINPSLAGSTVFQPEEDFGWYLFLGGEGRAVARNIFLDGNTFEDSHSVDKKTFVGDVQAGLAITFERVRLTYTYVFRTKEFEEQEEADQFGALSLSVRF
ncbi:MAG: lipid A deacylase LpxR family protein [Rhodovibrionaceae bacterium]|nr:lipid A deacylase LpxR family protein [Rhodovibrionaceae bacterium]